MTKEEMTKLVLEKVPFDIDIIPERDAEWEAHLQSMTWSYSRVKAFDDCSYMWLHTYINGDRGMGNGWSDAGTFSHGLMEDVFRGVLPTEQLSNQFYAGFDASIENKFPFPAMQPSLKSKIGRYFTLFRPRIDNVLGVEDQFTYRLPNGMLFTGFIDLVTKGVSGPVITDHKVSKPFSGEKLVDKRKQIHTYFLASPILYGQEAAAGYFHFLQDGTLVKVENNPQHVQETLDWIVDTIEKIKLEREWKPVLETMTPEEQQEQLFFCKHLCSHADKCTALKAVTGMFASR
jgi:hypothetical protein